MPSRTTLRPLPKPRNETLAVIGPGAQGRMIAYQALMNGFSVRLLGSGAKSSDLTAQFHTGNEYPCDRTSGRDCLLGSAIMRTVLPVNFLTSNPPIYFGIHRRTHEAGHRAIANGTADENTLTFEKQLESAEYFKEEYARLIEIKMKASNCSRAQAEESLHGELENFYRIIPRDELKYISYGADMAGAFQSNQRGIDIPVLNETLDHALQVYAEHYPSRLQIYDNTMVAMPDGVTRKYSKGERHYEYNVKIARKGKWETETFDQVVLAAGASNRAIANSLITEQEQKQGIEPAPMLVALRTMLILKPNGLRELRKPRIEGASKFEQAPEGHALFMLSSDGSDAGMVAFSGGRVLQYCPHDEGAHVAMPPGERWIELTPQNPLPPAEWKYLMDPASAPEHMSSDINRKLQQFTQRYAGISWKTFPELYVSPDPNIITPPNALQNVMCRLTISNNHRTAQRRNIGGYEITPGLHMASATKLVYTAAISVNTIKNLVMRHEKRHESLYYREWKEPTILSPEDPMMDAYISALQNANLRMEGVELRNGEQWLKQNPAFSKHFEFDTTPRYQHIKRVERPAQGGYRMDMEARQQDKRRPPQR